MALRRLQVFSKLRPLLPVIVGLSLGISMGIVKMPINHEDCVQLTKDHVDRKLNSLRGPKDINFLPGDEINGAPDFKAISKDAAERYRNDRKYVAPVYDSLEDFEPRIITDPELKPKINPDVEENKKKIVRTRFISTELGIRQKLVSAVLTSPSTFQTLGVAFNKTFTHRMKKVFFFSGIDEASNKNSVAAQQITLIHHPSNKPTQILYQTLTYLHKFKNDYDWYYITMDSTYSQADRINYIVDHISINRRLYMGKPSSYTEKTGEVSFCSSDNGFLISRLLLLDLMAYIKNCVQDVDMDELAPDKWLGRCLKRVTKGAVECVSEKEGISFSSYDLDPAQDGFNPETESSPAFKKAVSVSGVQSPQMMYTLHKRFSQIEIEKFYNEITEIQEEIRSLAPKLPEGEQELSWPIGINPPFKATTRWDIIIWDYFTEDYTLTCPGEIPKCALSGIDKIDVQNILQIALDRLNEKYSHEGLIITKKKLANGYRRFDPQRGMEYILDLVLNVLVKDASEAVEVNHRVELLRPLSEVEIVPMPYVTEAAKITVVLPLGKGDRIHFHAFMEKYAKVCLNSDENVGLSIVFVYSPADAQRIHDNDIFAEQKQLLQQYETRYRKASDGTKLIPWVSIKTEVPSQLKTMDVIAKTFPTDSLFFLTSVAANMNVNFLNRCRMNTIPGWQAFFPLPFSSYNPDIIFKNVPDPDQIEIKSTNGHFDLYSFDEVCIYNADYMASRTKMAAGQKMAESILEQVDTLDIYDMMIKYSQMHIFRAVEPMLTRRYLHRTCNIKNGEEIYQRCERSNAEGLASRTQLAMELFPDETKK